MANLHNHKPTIKRMFRVSIKPLKRAGSDTEAGLMQEICKSAWLPATDLKANLGLNAISYSWIRVVMAVFWRVYKVD